MNSATRTVFLWHRSSVVAEGERRQNDRRRARGTVRRVALHSLHQRLVRGLVRNRLQQLLLKSSRLRLIDLCGSGSAAAAAGAGAADGGLDGLGIPGLFSLLGLGDGGEPPSRERGVRRLEAPAGGGRDGNRAAGEMEVQRRQTVHQLGDHWALVAIKLQQGKPRFIWEYFDAADSDQILLEADQLLEAELAGSLRKPVLRDDGGLVLRNRVTQPRAASTLSG
jgi:hypothetical protein